MSTSADYDTSATRTARHSTGMAPPLTPSKRGRIIQMHVDGKPYRQIAEELGVTKSTAQRTVKKDILFNTRHDLPHPGRPKSTTAREERSMVAAALRDRDKPWKEVAGDFEQSYSTFSRVLRKHSYGRYVKQRSNYLSAKQVKARKQWVADNKDTNWKAIIFTDEAAFQVGDTKGREYTTRRPGEEGLAQCRKQTFRSGRTSLMVWGAMSFGRKWPLHRCHLKPSWSDGKIRHKAETMDGAYYTLNILKGPLASYNTQLKQELGEEVQVVEDNAPCHSSVITREAREELNISRLAHPSGSPDLNPIEMLWRDLKQMVRAKRPVATSLDGLWEQITTAYEEMPQRWIDNHILSMPDRWKAVKEAKGFGTLY